MDKVIGIIIGVMMIFAAVILIVAVLFQEGKDKSLSGAIAGSSSDTFYGKNKGKSRDAILNKVTVIVAVVFSLLVLVSFIMQDETDLSSSFDETTVAETTGVDSTEAVGTEALGTEAAATEAPETAA
jgi:preprotein translocase subunit SecG